MRAPCVYANKRAQHLHRRMHVHKLTLTNESFLSRTTNSTAEYPAPYLALTKWYLFREKYSVKLWTLFPVNCTQSNFGSLFWSCHQDSRSRLTSSQCHKNSLHTKAVRQWCTISCMWDHCQKGRATMVYYRLHVGPLPNKLLRLYSQQGKSMSCKLMPCTRQGVTDCNHVRTILNRNSQSANACD